MCDRDWWQRRSLVDGALLSEGAGLAFVAANEVVVADRTAVRFETTDVPLAGEGAARAGCGWAGWTVIARDGDDDIRGVWLVQPGQRPLRRWVPPKDAKVQTVASSGGALIVCMYFDGTASTEPRFESVRVDESGTAHPLVSASRFQISDAVEGPQTILIAHEDSWVGWTHVLRDSDDGRVAVASELHLADTPSWCTDETLLVPAYEGISVRPAQVAPSTGSWAWPFPPAEGSLSPVVGAGDGTAVAIHRPLSGPPTIVRLSSGGLDKLGPAPVESAEPVEVVTWKGPDGQLAGLLARPSGTTETPSVVDVHGGPFHTLIAGYPHELHRWSRAGFSALAPDYAASGIGGARRQLTAFFHPEADDRNPNVADVRSAATLIERLANSTPCLFGFSWGAYVVSCLLTTGYPAPAAVLWEGPADAISLEARGPDVARRRRWGDPETNPEPWHLPVAAADRVRAPVLLVYGADHAPEFGERWHAALTGAGVPTELWIYPGGHALEQGAVLDELYDRSIHWFRRWLNQP